MGFRFERIVIYLFKNNTINDLSGGFETHEYLAMIASKTLSDARGLRMAVSSKSGRTIYPKIGVWYRDDTGHIHLSIEGQGFSTVNADPLSKRGNPHLYRKLALMLKEAGAAHPRIDI